VERHIGDDAVAGRLTLREGASALGDAIRDCREGGARGEPGDPIGSFKSQES
jgi:hypothetical protein